MKVQFSSGNMKKTSKGGVTSLVSTKCLVGLVAFASSPTVIGAFPFPTFGLRNRGGLAAALLATVPSTAPRRHRKHQLFAHAAPPGQEGQPAGGGPPPHAGQPGSPPHAAPEAAANIEEIFSDLDALNMSVMCARDDAAQANSTANQALATCTRNEADIFNVNETATCAKGEALEAKADAANANATANSAQAKADQNEFDISSVNDTAVCAKGEALDAFALAMSASADASSNARELAEVNSTAARAEADAGKALDRAGTNSANIQKVNSTANEALGKADDNEDKIEEVNVTAVRAKDDVATVLATCARNEADIFGVNETAVCAKREALDAKDDAAQANTTANEAKSEALEAKADAAVANAAANSAMTEATNAGNAADEARQMCRLLADLLISTFPEEEKCELVKTLSRNDESYYKDIATFCPNCFYYDGVNGDDLTAQCSAASGVDCCRQGYQACLDATGIVCEDSCLGSEDSCLRFQGLAMKGSCAGQSACEDKKGFVDEDGCFEYYSCRGHTGSVGWQSCRGDAACVVGVFDAEDESCQGLGSCWARGDGRNRVGKVHAKACLGRYACAKSTAVIKSNACTRDCSCFGNTTDVIEAGTCIAACECANREDKDFNNRCVQNDGPCA